MSKEVILTGLRSNAEFHLGNYLGAIQPMVRLQQQKAGSYQLNMFVPDLHSFTTPVRHDQLYGQSITNVKMYVAAGLDIRQPDTFIYRQSFIPAHSEMTWILGCFAHYGELLRMTQFKEKGRGGQEGQTAGLFVYPVLMAADILLYDSRWVPVGEDQRQHLELTRDLAQRLNNKFGPLFTVPENWQKQLQFSGRDTGVRIRSLKNPQNKMSKSADDPAGTILLTDDPTLAAGKVMAATTDSKGSIDFDFDAQPGVSNLLQILALLGGQPQDKVNDQWRGKSGYSELKEAVAETVKIFLIDFQSRLSVVDEAVVTAALQVSEKKMSEVAGRKLYQIQQAVGLRPS